MDKKLEFINSWMIGLNKVVADTLVEQKNSFKLQEHELRTEYGNAQRFIYQHGAKVKYCHPERQWYIWTGKVWQVDTSGQVEVLAMSTARSIIAEAEKIGDLKEKTELQKWARSSLSHTRVGKTLKIAQTLVPVAEDQFDVDVWKLNVLNGIVDLRAGKLLPHDMGQLMTNMCNASYRDDATCPTWDKFLARIFDGKEDLIRYVQKMVGYALTGDISEKCFFILHGEKGDNGKTVFINVLKEILAMYFVQTPVDTLLRRKPGAQSNDLVRLDKARFVSGSETNAQCYFDEALVKRLTGDDAITARALYKEHVTFQPECKIFIATNRIPRFDKNDTAFNSRVKIIPFDVSIPVEEQDRNLKKKLLLEADGILDWAIRGCLLWQKEGLGAVPSVEVGVEVRPNSSVEHFVSFCCERGDNLQVKVGDLHMVYLAYHSALKDGSEPHNIIAFGLKLYNMGFITGHGRDGNIRVGIGLKRELAGEDDANCNVGIAA